MNLKSLICLFPYNPRTMFADLHHLHQFISLEQGGAVTATSWVGGTNAGDADIYFGEVAGRLQW